MPDISASVPVPLPLADTNLCALFGNALDNDVDVAQAAEKTVIVRCEVHKGLFILQVESIILNEELSADLSATKADKSVARSRAV